MTQLQRPAVPVGRNVSPRLSPGKAESRSPRAAFYGLYHGASAKRTYRFTNAIRAYAVALTLAAVPGSPA
jgi:hypothetical protein